MDPTVVNYAQSTFGVDVLCGPIEAQKRPLSGEPFGLCCAFDVFEHLPDPVGTLSRVTDILAPDGVVVLQLPEFTPARTADWQGFQVPEHLYLFTLQSLQRLLETAGFTHVHFEAPCFPTDMFVVASRAPLHERTESEIRDSLLSTPDGRILHAMLTLYQEALRAKSALMRMRIEASTQLTARLRRLFRGEAQPVEWLRRSLRR